MINTLEVIARHHLQQMVVVRVVALDWPQLGGATYGPGGLAMITLSEVLTPAALGFVFFHELGHLVLGHVARPGEPALSSAQLADLRGILPESPAVQRLVELEAQQEAEANAWADEQLANFERQFGPFVDAIRGDNYGTVTD